MNIFIKVWRWFIKLYRKLTDNWDLKIPEPKVKRTDILYGYYSTDDAQPAAVKDHTNLHWETQFQGEAGAIAHMQEMNCATVLDLASQVTERWHDGKYRVRIKGRDSAVESIRSFFTDLRDAGVLHLIVGLTPHDEPNLHGINEADLTLAVAYIREVASEFEELKDVKMVCIYQATEGWTGIHLFDWVGFDDYKRRSTVLEGGYGAYGQFKKYLRPDQRTMILPGGTYGHDPKPFVNFAHNNPEVVMVLPFLWHPVENPDEQFPGIGYGDTKVRDWYVAAGKELTGKA